jgi:hypothetical protein
LQFRWFTGVPAGPPGGRPGSGSAPPARP